MSSAFLAWIIPVNTGAHPEHPIVIPPDQPPGTQPPEGAPPHPSHPIVLPGYPAHPIYLPPWIWGGGNVPMPTPPIANVPGAPGYKPPSDAHPEHPIVIPPGTWGGANEPFPTPPIVIPNPPDTKPPGGETGTPENPIELPPPEPGGNRGHWAQAYFPALDGWIWVWVPEKQMPPHVEHFKGKKK